MRWKTCLKFSFCTNTFSTVFCQFSIEIGLFLGGLGCFRVFWGVFGGVFEAFLRRFLVLGVFLCQP